MTKSIRISLFFLFALTSSLSAQTIAEKKAGITGGTSELTPELQKFLVEINKEIKEKNAEILQLHEKVMELFLEDAPPEAYQGLLYQINDIKETIRILQESWREMATQPGTYDEGYALWHQPETTIEQLIIDYGSNEYVYLIPSEIAGIQLSVTSNIPIPRASWPEMLEQIMLQNGVGIKVLNPFLRQLFLVREDLSNLKLITNDPDDLEVFPSNARVSFVLTPEPMDVRRIWYFLEKFTNLNSTVLQRIGRVILVVGDVASVKETLKLYDFVTANKQELDYKAIPLFRVDAEEMANILSAIFEEFVEEIEVVEAEQDSAPTQAAKGAKGKKPTTPRRRTPSRSKGGSDVNSLRVIALPKVTQAVFLIGTKEEIQKAEEIIQQVEQQVGEARDRTVYWYHVKHSDPEEVAQILQRVYSLMLKNRVGTEEELAKEELTTDDRRLQVEKDRLDLERERLARQEDIQRTQERTLGFVTTPFFQQGGYTVNPRPVTTGQQETRQYNVGRDNFIVDPKTGSLVMVVEVDILPQLKEVLKKIDVPKKMVKIEVLLFERVLNRNTSYGLNLLNIGTAAAEQRTSSATWSGGISDCPDLGNRVFPSNPTYTNRICDSGILEFFFSRAKASNGFPAFDIAYKFLMTQDDVYLNASPSVVTMNQTPAVIAIQDERSIRVGTSFSDTTNVTAQDAFTRAQYGITINVTPTIHMSNGEEDFFEDPTNYVSLVSEITFDTFAAEQTTADQPIVNRRQVVNEVSVPDGQTVIIGGLRRKQTEDSCQKVPFLGEIPGLGKLFSTTSLSGNDAEMIIFITPTIITEPKEDFARLRYEELCRRPGDLPAFLCKLNEALECEKGRLFQGYMSMIFGRPRPRYVCEEVEYDGR